MNLKLICPMEDSSASLMDDPANAGFELSSILGLLKRAEERGHTVSVMGIEALSEDERDSLYLDAVSATQRAGAR